MGPRFFKRGEQTCSCSLRSSDRGFNGATLLQAWRGRGDGDRCAAPLLLQWGHASSSVERTQAACRQSRSPLASMGPRFFKRGEIICIPTPRISIHASMGPRFFKRGEYPRATNPPRQQRGFNGATLLQAWRVGKQSRLKAERRRFNGATLLQAWRVVLSPCLKRPYPSLQWGHASSSVER